MATHLITRAEAAYPGPAATMREDDIDIPTLVTTLSDHKWSILFGTMLFFAISVIYVLLATPKYEANAVVQVESRPPTVPGLTPATHRRRRRRIDAPAATEIAAAHLAPRAGRSDRHLDLDIAAKPVHLPLIGDTRRPHAAAAAARALSRAVVRPEPATAGAASSSTSAGFDVPERLIDLPLQLIAGERGRYTLLDPDGKTAAARAASARPPQGGGVTMRRAATWRPIPACASRSSA